MTQRSEFPCEKCFFCWKTLRRYGNSAQYKEVIWRCLKRPGYPKVYVARFAYNKLSSERKLIECCDLFEPHPWEVSEKFEEWLRNGIELEVDVYGKRLRS